MHMGYAVMLFFWHQTQKSKLIIEQTMMAEKQQQQKQNKHKHKHKHKHKQKPATGDRLEFNFGMISETTSILTKTKFKITLKMRVLLGA